MTTGVEGHTRAQTEVGIPPQPHTIGPNDAAVADVRDAVPLPARPRVHPLVRRAVLVDAGAVVAASYLAYLIRFRAPDRAHSPLYELVCLGITVLWMALLTASNAYDPRIITGGNEGYKRQALATARVFVTIALVSYVGKLQVARIFIFIALPLGLVLLFIGRWTVNRWLARQQAAGQLLRRVLLVGDNLPVVTLATRLSRDGQGFTVVGACSTEAMTDVAVLGAPLEAPALARQLQVDTVMLAASSSVGAELVKQISWGLEGSGIDVVVAPALVDVAGPRLTMQPVAGVPMLHVEEPEFVGTKRVLKRALDLALAGVGLGVLSPVLLALAVVVKATSRGPVFFRQVRVGTHGETFRVWKFRSMHVNAEERLAELRQLNDASGLLFKLRDDPRVTSAGRWMRRYSLDELPQLLNVIGGSMSLVGPRPPLPVEVQAYTDTVKRRLLVQPGITGLWQVSGRSDLSWDEAVRLDLYYVENWSILLDLIILLRTVRAVVRSRGAY